MIYAVIKGQFQGRVILVSARDEDDVKERLNLAEDEKIVGQFTEVELGVLNSSGFNAVTG